MTRLRLQVKQVGLPCYRPYVVVDTDTNEILAHCKTNNEARQRLAELRGSSDSPTSQIPLTNNVTKALELRMKYPLGEPRKKLTGVPKRKVVL